MRIAIIRKKMQKTVLKQGVQIIDNRVIQVWHNLDRHGFGKLTVCWT